LAKTSYMFLFAVVSIDRNDVALLEQIIVVGTISSRVSTSCSCHSTTWRPCCFMHFGRCSSIRQVTMCCCRVAC